MTKIKSFFIIIIIKTLLICSCIFRAEIRSTFVHSLELAGSVLIDKQGVLCLQHRPQAHGSFCCIQAENCLSYLLELVGEPTSSYF